ARTTNPVPSPAEVRGCARPKKMSNGSCGAWLTCSVCTVTTDGEILATAFVIAFCRVAEIWLDVDGTIRPDADCCAFDESGGCEHPTTAARRNKRINRDLIRRSLPVRDRAPADTPRHRGTARAPRRAAMRPRWCQRSAAVPRRRVGGAPWPRRASFRREI